MMRANGDVTRTHNVFMRNTYYSCSAPARTGVRTGRRRISDKILGYPATSGVGERAATGDAI